MPLLENQINLSKEEETELRLLCAEIEHRRRVNPLSFYQHLPQQEVFHNDPSKIKAIFGGNRAGKTEEVAEYVIRRCLTKPKQRWWACAETFSDSVNIQQRKVWEILPKNQIMYGYYDDINGFTNRKLKLKNGSLINFKSYDQGIISFAQDDCDGIWDDEEPPYDIVKEQRMRLIDRNGELIISMTSIKGVTDLIADIFEDCDVLEVKHSDILNEDLPIVAEKNGIKFYMLWTTDNPYIDQERLKQEIKFMTRDEIKSRIHGIPVNLSGKIYISFNRRIHVISFDDLPSDNNFLLFHILDPHDRKPWAMQWIALHKTGTAYCVDEYPNKDFNEMLSDDKTYDEYVSIIREKENALFDIFGKGIYKRIIDPNFGNKTIRLAEKIDERAHTTPKEELKKRGLDFKDGIDMLEAGHLKVREMLHYEVKGNEIVMQPKFFLTDNCINSIKHLSRYSRKDIMTPSGDVKDNAGVQEKYKDFCFDKETEILTKTGWKKFIDLKDDLVATVNLNNFNLEFQKPIRHIRYFYEGMMVYINARCINALITSDHKMVIKTQANQVSKGKIKFELAKNLTPQITIPIACNGIDSPDDGDKEIIFDKKGIFHHSIKNQIKIKKKVWASFIGLYLAEGSATGTKGGKIQIPGRGYSVYITQSKNSRHLDKVKELLNKMPFKFRYNGRSFVCSNKLLWNYLYPLGNSYQKYIPKEIFNYGRDSLLEMWKFLVIGDGWARNDGTFTYCTVSKKLFDDIQTLLTLLGIPSGITIRNMSGKKADSSVIKKQPKNGFATQYWITAKTNKFAGICQSGQNKQAKQYSNIDYKDDVFCVTVPNGTVIVRRKNRIFVSGNCDLSRYFWMSNPRYIEGEIEFVPQERKVY